MATSAGTGFWDVGATWVGGVVPTDVAIVATGHTVTIRTAITLGTPGAGVAEGVIICTVQGTLLRGVGGSFRCVGDARVENGFIDFATSPGGNWIFGAGGTTQKYKIRGSASSSETSSRVAFSGSLIGPESGAGNGGIVPDSTWFLGVSLVDCVVTDCGTSGGNAVSGRVSGALQKWQIHHTEFVRCGYVRCLACPGDRDYDVDRVLLTDQLTPPATANALSATLSARTTGLRVFKNIAAEDAMVGHTTSRKDLICEDVLCARMDDSSVSGAIAASMKRIMTLPRAQFIKSLFGIAGEVIEDVGCLVDSNLEDNAGFTGSATASGTVTFRGGICQHTLGEEGTDFFKAPNPSSAVMVYDLDQWLMLLDSRMLPAGNIESAHGNMRTSFKFRRCTGGTHEDQAPASNAYFAFNVGTVYNAHPGMIQEAEDNLIYAPLPLSAHGYGFLHYSGSTSALTGASLAGTPDATSTVNRIDCIARGWGYAVGERLVDGQAKVVITDNILGTGPPIGETRDIVASGQDWIEVTGNPFTAIPNSGTRFRIFILDVMPASEVGHNAYFNVRDGINYAADGYTQVTKKGCAGFTFSDHTAYGVGDVDLGGGDMFALGLFVDPTRGFVNYASRYLGPAGLATTPGLWASGNTYVKGDRKRSADAAVFAGEELWYSCHTTKGSASASGDRPGTTGGKAYWRPSFGKDVGALIFAGVTITDPELGLTNATPLTHAFAYIRRGWAPTDVRVHNASSTGGDIGAVPFFATHISASGTATVAFTATGSCTIRPVRISASGTSTVSFSGTGTASFSSAVAIGMTGVRKLFRAVTTDRPLLLRIDAALALPPAGHVTASGASTVSFSATGTAAIRNVRVSASGAATVSFSGTGSCTIRALDPDWNWLMGQFVALTGQPAFGYRREDLTVAGGELDVWTPFGSAGLGNITAADLGTRTPAVDPVTGDVLVVYDADPGLTTELVSPSVAGLHTNRALTIYRVASFDFATANGLDAPPNYLRFAQNQSDLEPFYGRVGGRSHVTPGAAVTIESPAPNDNEDVLRVTRLSKNATTGFTLRALRFGTAVGQWGEVMSGTGDAHSTANGLIGEFGYPSGTRISDYILVAAAPSLALDAAVEQWAEAYRGAYCAHSPLLWHAGDSITNGQQAQSHITFPRMTWKGLGTRYDLLITGVPSSQVLDQKNEAPGGQLALMTAVLGTGRQYVVCVTQGGINNLFSTAQTGAEIFADMLTVWARLREVGAAAGYTVSGPGQDFWIVQTMPTDVNTMDQTERLALMALLLAAVPGAPNFDGLARIDLEQVGDNNPYDDIVYVDHIHPNDEGHRQMAVATVAEIQSLLYAHVEASGTASVSFSATGTCTIRSAAPPGLAQLQTDLGGTLAYAWIYGFGATLVATKLSNWVDQIAGLDAAQGTDAKRATDDGTTYNYDGVDDVSLTPLVPGLSLDTNRSVANVGAVNSGSNAKYAMAVVNAAITRYIGIYGGTTNITCRTADSAGTCDQSTGKAKGTAIRCVVTQRQATPSLQMASLTYAGSVILTPDPTGTIAVEDMRVSIGGIGDSNYSTSRPRAVLVSTPGTFWTTAQRDFIRAWAAAYHASLDA